MKKNHAIMPWLVGVLALLLLVGVALLGCLDRDVLLAKPAARQNGPENEFQLLGSRGTQFNQASGLSGLEGEDAPAEDAPAPMRTDYDAIYALHEPDEVVLTVDGQEFTWQDYFFAYYSQAHSMEQAFQMYQQYGLAIGWQDQADQEGHTYAELLGPTAEENLRQISLVEKLAEENGVTLSEEDEKALQEQHRTAVESYAEAEDPENAENPENPENAEDLDPAEERFFEHLQEDFRIRPEFYWRITRYGFLVQSLYRELYGEDGEKLPEERVLTWMEEQGIVSADHILISTMDLDEAGAAEKAALAQQLAEELQGIEDPAAREARFLELKAEYGEDPGAEAGGYVFGPGVMVDEFYQGALALEEGQISDPVQTRYGCHIILRRPLHADDKVYTGTGEQSARSMLAEELFSSMAKERYEVQAVEYAEGFEVPNILDYRVSAAEDK